MRLGHLGSSSLDRFGQYFFTKPLVGQRGRQTEVKKGGWHTHLHTVSGGICVSLKTKQDSKIRGSARLLPQAAVKQPVNDLTVGRGSVHVCFYPIYCLDYTFTAVTSKPVVGDSLITYGSITVCGCGLESMGDSPCWKHILKPVSILLAFHWRSLTTH